MAGRSQEPKTDLHLWVDSLGRSGAGQWPCRQGQQGGRFSVHPKRLALGSEHTILTVPYFNREKTTRKSVLQRQWQGVL